MFMTSKNPKPSRMWPPSRAIFSICTGAGEPARLDGTRVSARFFPALGVTPALGRAFTAAEDRPGAAHFVVLSDRLWRERFGADPAIVGRSIELSGAPYTVTGVMPPGFAFPHAEEMPHGFQFPRAPQLWVPLALAATTVHPWDPDELAIVARLRPGATIAQAQAEMDLFCQRREEENRRAKGWYTSHVTPMTRQAAGDARRPLLLILASVGVVLLIACSNVASLVLARSIPRRREFTLRAALGAGRMRLVRQLLTENILLAFAGGLGGVLLANAGVGFVQRFGPQDLPRLGDATLNGGVLAFAFAVTMLTGILFGMAPAAGAARENLADSLKEGGQRLAGGALAVRLRQGLLVSQVALALVLVIAAGLLCRTFIQMLRADSGFRAERVLTFELSLPPAKYDDSGATALYSNVLRRLRSASGVEAAGIAKTIPMGGAPDSTGIRIAGRPLVPNQPRPFAAYNLASPGYFAAVGTPILRGRDFIDGDVAAGAQPVVIINRAMADRFWPDGNALGQQVGPGSLAFPLMTVIGIAADAKDLSLRQQPGPEMYVPYTLRRTSLLTMQAAVRTKADPASMAQSITAAVRTVDPDLPLAKVAAMETLVDESTAPARSRCTSWAHSARWRWRSRLLECTA